MQMRTTTATELQIAQIVAPNLLDARGRTLGVELVINMHLGWPEFYTLSAALVRAFVGLLAMKRLVGHQNPRLTASTYCH